MGVASSKHRFRPATFIYNLRGFAALPASSDPALVPSRAAGA